MSDPTLTEYDDRQAVVCQALEMKPKAWQVGGRMVDGGFFFAVKETEEAARRVVRHHERLHRIDGGAKIHSHMICAQYPDLSDAWALEAMRAVGAEGYRVTLTHLEAGMTRTKDWKPVAGRWSVQVYRAGKLQGGAGGATPGEAVRDGLYFVLRLHRAA